MDSRLIKPKGLPKPLLLKDYLLDDMSSCSSNGFKLFPRRQCCATTVGFLIEIDLKNKHRQKKYLNFNKNPPVLLKSPSKSALSAFKSVISAVKRLPFGGTSSPEKNKPKKSILPRNLSKKILKKSSFWKRKSNHKEIERWKSFDQFLKEDSAPLDISDSSVTTTTSDGKSKSWSESDFTASDECSSGNSSGDVNLNLSEVRNNAVEVPPQNGDVSTTTSSDSSTTTTNSSTKQKQWSVNEEKEQFSPVSVLDCPFEDDEEVSSPFQHKLQLMEGTKKQLMKKIQRFDYLAQLEPLDLTKRFATLPESDNENSSASIDEKVISDMERNEQEEEMENQAANKALDLLQQMKDTLPSYGLKVKAEKILLDFFTEKIMHSQRRCCGYSFDEELLEEAENWINGRKSRELFLEWEVPRNREVYVRDMERGGEWRSLDQENNKEVALELENLVFDAMLSELLLDMSS